MAQYKKTLSLDSIVLDGDNQYRFALNEEHADDLKQAYLAEEEIPPPVVWKFEDRHLLSQGFHRITGAKAAGLDSLECWVKEGTIRDFKIDCITGNAKHGLKLTSKEKRHAVAELLKLCPEWSDPRVANEIGCSTTTVVDVREELVKESAIPEVVERVGADGKTRKAKQQKEKDTNIPYKNQPEEQAETTVASSRVESDAGQTEPVVEKPNVPKTHVEDGEPPMDERFMPNAMESRTIAVQLTDWKQQLEAVKRRLKATFPVANHPMAERINAKEIENQLSDLIEVMGSQIPEYPCPACCGTTKVEGQPCKPCDAYGVVSQSHYEGLKPMWKRTRTRYEELSRKAELAEVE